MKQYHVYIILVLLIAFTYGNSLQNSFVWDDHTVVIKNPKISPSLREIPSVFLTPLWKAAGVETRQVYYRPMVTLVGILNYKIWGLDPLGFHLTNILLHLITAIFVYRVGFLLFEIDANKELISLIAASIFVVYPVHNESVGRPLMGESLHGLFIILSLYFFLRERRYLSWITFSLALLSKELAVMLPFALVILAVHKKGFKRGIILIIPYMVLVGVYLVLRAMIVDYVFGDNVGQPVFMRLLTMSVATFDYARLLLFPYPLSPFYLEKWYTSFEPKVLLAILFLITIFLLAFKLRKDKVMIFLLLFPFMMLAPAIWRVNTFLAGQDHVYIAERFLYVPAIAFSLFISYSVARLFKDSARRYMIIGWLSVISIFITIAITSNRMWADDFTLSKKIIEKSPEATFVRNNLGLIYNSKGLTDMAIEQFRTVIKLKPDNYIAYINLGNAYGLKGLTDMAIEQYQTAIKLQPDDPNAYNNLGGAYRSKGLIDKAIEQYLIALRLNANIPEVHYNLGNVYLSKDMVDKAIECYEHAIKLKPDDADIHDNLGFAYHKKGSIKKAEDHFRMADAIRSKQK